MTDDYGLLVDSDWQQKTEELRFKKGTTSLPVVCLTFHVDCPGIEPVPQG
jgi:hypothetical protein